MVDLKLVENEEVVAVDDLLDPANKTLRNDTHKWASRARRRAKDLAGKLEVGYMELAKLLYLVDDTPIDGDPQKGAIWRQWGYESLAEYAEVELNLYPRKTQSLKRIWYTLEVELASVPSAVRKEIVGLGWSKARLLCPVLTTSNTQEWSVKAKNCSYPELERMVMRYKEAKQQAVAEMLSSATPLPEPETVVKEVKIRPGLPPKTAEKVATSPKFHEIKDIPISVPIPDRESIKNRMFGLSEDAYAVVKKAIDKAENISGSDKQGYNLQLICMDFLGSDLAQGGISEKLDYIRRLEKSLGFKLIAVDPDTDEILYGDDTLKNMADRMEARENAADLKRASGD